MQTLKNETITFEGHNYPLEGNSIYYNYSFYSADNERLVHAARIHGLKYLPVYGNFIYKNKTGIFLELWEFCTSADPSIDSHVGKFAIIKKFLNETF